ncbi:hypothetical protein U9M48_004688 [Paspalum notatum var. saurae]|uniref:DUF1618 domain-containing protein n=1 Tax=Paspalum notatum var. saurae TaxID=547442 RepID=A0AAQ3PW27_PASNO
MSSSGHRRSRRSFDYGSSSSSSASGKSTRASTGDTDVPGGDPCSKRLSGSLSRGGSPESSYPSWVLLNQFGACRDGFHGDRTTSATSRTSNGKQVSVSLELVEPPGTSVLIVDYPQAQAPSTSFPQVIAAHRDVVLLDIISPGSCRASDGHDHFVYQASSSSSSSSRRPSLSPLPAPPEIVLMDQENMGVMPSTSQDQADDEDPSFMVAHLETSWQCPGSKPSEATVHMFRSAGSGEWETFENLRVRRCHGGRDLWWWSTDAVVPYQGRFLIWVDYYRGVILLDTSSQSEKDAPPLELRYVPLPLDKDAVSTDPDDIELGRGQPEESRCVCATRDGIKFVSVDTRHCSSFGVGHLGMLKWKHTFWVTTWSLREDNGCGYTWIKDATMSQGELWAALDSDSERQCIPHMTPEFPVVNMENPDAVCFRLDDDDDSDDDDPEEPAWMIEVHMKKKALLAATAYSKKKCLNGVKVDEGTIKSARTDSYDHALFPSELPSYLDGKH